MLVKNKFPIIFNDNRAENRADKRNNGAGEKPVIEE
jgi:hypothetical protein